MKRTSYPIQIAEHELLQIHRHFTYSVSLSGKQTPNRFSVIESIHGFGALKQKQLSAGNALSQLQQSINEHNDWHFICLAYDLKNEIEDLTSSNSDLLQLPDLFYFIPKYVVITKKNKQLLLCKPEDKDAFFQLLNQEAPGKKTEKISIELQAQLSEKEYAKKFNEIQENIQLGNIYEMNFCQQFIQKNIQISPIYLYKSITEKIAAPFMAFLQMNGNYLLSASPERYLLKTGSQILSQPIKGTAKREKTLHEDEQVKKLLKNDLKEQTENVMIVDLVRNDLGKCCVPGSVKVVEMQGLYSFSTVHQLISTVQGQIKPNINFTDIIRNTFPMGSMTGAPKFEVLQLTEKTEDFKRSWYSGAVGYLAPTGDFDFNVIIRSFLYNEQMQLLTYGVGSGITSFSKAEKEYEECIVKVESLVHLINETDTA